MQNIILLHGALGSASDLAESGSALSALNFKVHRFSFSGHGHTAVQHGFGIEQFSKELELYITEHSLAPAVIFGYSMGGFVALHLASQQPQLISKIITLGTKFNWSSEAVEKETRLLNPAVIVEKVPAFAAALEKKHGAGWQTTVIRTVELMREIGEKQLLAPAVLKTIATPVLLGLGDRDQMVTLEETTAVFKMLPDAGMYMLPKTKHQLETANTALLAKLIAEFVKQ